MSKNPVFTSRVTLCFAFFALVAGIKFMLIASFGTTTPYWDQWDAEIDRLYRPWLEGSLQWQSLIAPHNEHRIFTGRLLALTLFVLNGNVLDISLQIVINALLHVGTLLVFLYGLLDMISGNRDRFLLTFFAALIFAMPLGVDNLLLNNSSLYLIILFSLLFLHSIAAEGTHSTLFWFFKVLVSGLLACLSFASGALTIASGIALLIIQWIAGVRRNRSSMVMILILTLMMIAAVYFTPTLPGHSHFKSRSVIDFMVSILAMTGGIVFYLPSIFFMLRQLRKKPKAEDPAWFLFALCLWIFGQMLVIAYGRGHSNVLASRYLDLYTIGFVANLAALFVNMRDPILNWSIKPLKTWLLFLFIGFGILLPKIARQLDKTKEKSAEYDQRIKTYLATHDSGVLVAADAQIPYPDAVRLRMLLDQRTVQSMLPETLTGGISGSREASVKSSSKMLFLAGSVLAGIGTGLFSTLFISGCTSVKTEDVTEAHQV